MTSALVLFVVLGWPAAVADSQPGTHVALRLESTVSTGTAKPGDPVLLRTVGATLVDGVAIPAGSDARGVVARVARPGRVRGRGEVEIAVVAITLPGGGALAVTSSTSIEPRRRTAAGARPYPAPPPHVPILLGMVAGYGTAALVSKASNSEDAIVKSGVVAGLTTGVLVGVLKRGEDLVLYPGVTIDVVVARAK